VFSEAHVDYAGAAWQAGIEEAAGRPTRYAMRACDITRTPPRVGDLVCQARGAGAGLRHLREDRRQVLATRDTGGDALADALRRGGGGRMPRASTPWAATCCSRSRGAGSTLRRARACSTRATCRRDARLSRKVHRVHPRAQRVGCIDRHMSRQPWSLLLQWR
jgi:hypothetical protein